jgi:hypothetical protein
MIIVQSSDSKIKTLLEKKEKFETRKELEKFLTESGEKDIIFKESSEGKISILRVLKG